MFFCDSDWGNCMVDRRSYSGYTILQAGAAVGWESRKQRSLALKLYSVNDSDFPPTWDRLRADVPAMLVCFHTKSRGGGINVHQPKTIGTLLTRGLASFTNEKLCSQPNFLKCKSLL